MRSRGSEQKRPMRPKAKSRQHRKLIRGSAFVHGRRTSISLEPVMWDAFREIAAEPGKIVNQLVTELSRQHPVNLSASIRVYIVEYYRAAQRSGARVRTHKPDSQGAHFLIQGPRRGTRNESRSFLAERSSVRAACAASADGHSRQTARRRPFRSRSGTGSQSGAANKAASICTVNHEFERHLIFS
jgi:predicted DNA-binding ribbon-helix-helix protein